MPTRVDSGPLASELRVVLGHLIRRLRTQHRFSLSQGSVLGRLDREGPQSTSNLATAERVRPQSMGQTVAELEAQGLVERRADPDDGRRALIELTEAGRVELQRGPRPARGVAGRGDRGELQRRGAPGAGAGGAAARAVGGALTAPAPSDRRRWIALVVLCLGPADDRARRDHRQRRPALDPERPRLHPGEPDLGRQRLPDRLRQLPAAGRAARRPDRPQEGLHRRPDAVHPRLGALRARRRPDAADRGPLRPGRRRRGRLLGDHRDHRHRVPAGRGSRRKRWASSPSSPRPAARSACWPAASSPTRSTGTGSSSSTCRSACWRSGSGWSWSRRTRGRACARASTSSARC